MLCKYLDTFPTAADIANENMVGNIVVTTSPFPERCTDIKPFLMLLGQSRLAARIEDTEYFNHLLREYLNALFAPHNLPRFFGTLEEAVVRLETEFPRQYETRITFRTSAHHWGPRMVDWDGDGWPWVGTTVQARLTVDLEERGLKSSIDLENSRVCCSRYSFEPAH